ncbi:MAG: Uma2 family endonuclease [Cyanobacteria bacterium J06581_3]
MVLSVAPDSAKTIKTYTEQEYLVLEVESDIRNEFRDGVIVPMVGGTPEHNMISSALNALLWFGLRKKSYTVFVSDQRLWIPAANLHTYPDVMITPKPPELKAGRKDTVVNPIFVAETLSSSTQGYDRGDKFAHYRTINSFQEYLLIEQYQPRVEHYVKQGENQWLLTEYSGLDATFHLSSVDIEIALSDLYENVEFGASKAEA